MRPGGGRVFLSYRRKDGEAHARYLAGRLDGDFEVFIDQDSIAPGDRFDTRLERMIESSDVVLAVLTEGFLNEEAVCRDEILYAADLGKRIIPLRFTKNPGFRPPLLLLRRQWIDFSAEPDASFDRLVAALRGPPGVGGFLPEAPLAPIDFTLELKYARNFVGREWLVKTIENWPVKVRDTNLLGVFAPPGFGKTALAAWLAVNRHSVVAAVHFCNRAWERSCDPSIFVQLIAHQLSTQIPEFLTALQTRRPENPRPSARDAFRELVAAPASEIAYPGEPLWIIVDSLHEAAGPGDRETIADVVLDGAKLLPSWLRILATARSEPPLVNRFTDVIDHLSNRPENLDDIRRYALARVDSGADAAGGDRDALAHRVQEVAQGNFLYAKLTMDALNEGILTPGDIGRLPQRLPAYYTEMFQRRFPDHAQFAECYVPLLSLLIAAPAPLDETTLRSALSLAPLVLHERITRIQWLLQPCGDKEPIAYSLFHASLREWLGGRLAGLYWCDAQVGASTLAATFLAQVKRPDASTTALEYVVACLETTGRADDSHELLCSPAFAEQRCRANLLFKHLSELKELKDLATHNQAFDAFAVAIERVCATLRTPDLWQVLRAALNSFFEGLYARWPEPLRERFERSKVFEVCRFVGDTADMEGRHEHAEHTFSRLRWDNQHDPDRHAAASIQLAKVYDHMNRFDEGLAALASVSSAAGDRYQSWAHYHKAILLRRLGDHRNARRLLERIACDEDPGLAISSRHQLGVIRLKLSDAQDAIHCFTRCLEERGTREWDHRRAFELRRLGQAQSFLGEYDAARKLFDEAIKLSRFTNPRYVSLCQRDSIAYVELPIFLDRHRTRHALSDLCKQFGLDEPDLLLGFRSRAGRDFISVIQEDGAPTGMVVPFRLAHEQGLLHRTVSILLCDRAGKVALQKRVEHPSDGRWDVTAAGHCDVGESPIQTAVRELYEEAKVLVSPGELSPLHKIDAFEKTGDPAADLATPIHVGSFSLRYQSSKRNRERVTCFLLQADEDLLLRLNDRPTGGVELSWVELDEAFEDARRRPNYASSFMQLAPPFVRELITLARAHDYSKRI